MDLMCRGELLTELSRFNLARGSTSFLKVEDKLSSRLEQLILAHGVSTPLTLANDEHFGGVILLNDASIVL